MEKVKIYAVYTGRSQGTFDVRTDSGSLYTVILKRSGAVELVGYRARTGHLVAGIRVGEKMLITGKNPLHSTVVLSIKRVE